MSLLLNQYPYSDYQKINLDWLLDLGNKLKADAASGEFDGERGKGVYGITTIHPENNYYYAYKSGDIGVGDFLIGYGAAGDSTLYFMKVTSVVDNELRGDSIIRITGPQGEQGPQGEPGEGGLTEAMKQALLQLARKVAYIDGEGQTYYTDLHNAFYPPAGLVSISAVFAQGSNIIYDTDNLSVLRQYLTVTAHYDDSTSAVVTAYTLSGTLTAGNSTITVAYGGQSTTFVVAVTHYEEPAQNYVYNWDFTQSLVDTVGGVEAVLSANNASRDATGLHITGANGFANFGKILAPNRVYELDIGNMDTSNWTSGHGRLFIWYSGNGSGLVYRSSGAWAIYKGSWVETSPAIADKAYFANSTLKIKTTNTTSSIVYIYKDNVEVMQAVTNNDPISANNDLYIGGAGSSAAFSVTITAMRVYEEV